MLYNFDDQTSAEEQIDVKKLIMKKFNLHPTHLLVEEVNDLIRVTFNGPHIGFWRVPSKFVKWVEKDYNGNVFGNYRKYPAYFLGNWKIYPFTIDVSIFKEMVKDARPR